MASSKSFFSLLAGLAAGAAFGILYAPDKGWKTRARVKKAAENGYEDLKENLGDLGTKVDEKAAQAKASLKDIRETLRSKGAEIKEDIGRLLEAGALVRMGDRYRIPEDHFFVSDEIIRELI